MWICPKCERELKNASQRHYCAKVSIDSLFEGKSAELAFVFDKLLSEIADWEDVAVSATPNCIVFVHNQTFLVIRPMRKQLDIKFYSATPQEDELIVKNVPWAGKYENHIRVSTLEDITEDIYTFIRRSYQLL